MSTQPERQSTKPSHTPGPWTVRDSSRCYHVVSADTLFQTGCISFDGRGEANARLIAAAPELLAAAKMIASFAMSWQPLTPGDIKELTNAIAKAEGR